MTVTTIADRVRSALEISGADCGMEEIVSRCPDLTWSQVFMGVDHLSRTGQVRLTLNRERSYSVTVLPS